MKLDKAIGILNGLERTLAPTMSANGTDAIKLGIEALKRLQEHRTSHVDIGFRSLPGETEE